MRWHTSFDRLAAETPAAPAVEDDTLRWTYAELVDKSLELAAGLRAQTTPGDLVVLSIPRNCWWLAVLVACSREGLRVVFAIQGEMSDAAEEAKRNEKARSLGHQAVVAQFQPIREVYKEAAFKKAQKDLETFAKRAMKA
jgi:non-ribosomal peptide synthetase component E (peptide arylation enzyme)